MLAASLPKSDRSFIQLFVATSGHQKTIVRVVWKCPAGGRRVVNSKGNAFTAEIKRLRVLGTGPRSEPVFAGYNRRQFDFERNFLSGAPACRNGSIDGELAFSTVMTGSDIAWFVSDQIREALFHFPELANT